MGVAACAMGVAACAIGVAACAAGAGARVAGAAACTAGARAAGCGAGGCLLTAEAGSAKASKASVASPRSSPVNFTFSIVKPLWPGAALRIAATQLKIATGKQGKTLIIEADSNNKMTTASSGELATISEDARKYAVLK